MIEKSKSYLDTYGGKYWYIPSNGPAVEDADGAKEWWVDNKQLDTEEIKTWIEENKVDLSEPEGKMAFKLRWI